MSESLTVWINNRIEIQKHPLPRPDMVAQRYASFLSRGIRLPETMLVDMNAYAPTIGTGSLIQYCWQMWTNKSVILASELGVFKEGLKPTYISIQSFETIGERSSICFFRTTQDSSTWWVPMWLAERAWKAMIDYADEKIRKGVRRHVTKKAKRAFEVMAGVMGTEAVVQYFKP